MTMPFADRGKAGDALAEKLRSYIGQPDTLVLALVRGGVAVGRALADCLHLPLFPYVVRKIGMPGHREFGVGAIAEGGATYMDEETLRGYGLTENDLQPIIDEERRELTRRTRVYAVHERPNLAGKTIILTDDGAATGGTLFAAIDDLRQANVHRIILAIPVAPPDTAKLLRARADETVILQTPRFFGAVGNWYADFPQLTDPEVLALICENRECI